MAIDTELEYVEFQPTTATPASGTKVAADLVTDASGDEVVFQIVKLDVGGAGDSVPLAFGSQIDDESLPVVLSQDGMDWLQKIADRMAESVDVQRGILFGIQKLLEAQGGAQVNLVEEARLRPFGS